MTEGPRYPIYIPSKGRAGKSQTIHMFLGEGVEFKVVVEPQEVENYATEVGRNQLLVLPDNDQGLVYVRNWIKDHSVSEGHERHWQFDDDVFYFSRVHRGYRIRCPARVAIVLLEDFVDRYENVALASFDYEKFILVAKGHGSASLPPFCINKRCYTVFLMLNSLPNRWRYRYNEDTDMTLQVLADGWCTILLNAFVFKTMWTMQAEGGQKSVYTGDGRLRMARELERVWPSVVTVDRRFRRPQHVVDWTKFDTQLRLKPDVDLFRIEPNEHGLVLKQVASVKSEGLRKLLEE